MALPTWLGKLLVANTGNTIKAVRGLVDEVITNDEERAELELKVKEEINRHRMLLQAEVTGRLDIDNQYGSWLTRNVRPLILIFVVVVLSVAMLLGKDYDQYLLGIFENITQTAIGFYFGGRSAEKVIQLIKKKNKS